VPLLNGIAQYRKAEQWESTQLENNVERKAQLARQRLIINSVLHDSAANGEFSVYRVMSLWEPEPERLAWVNQTTLTEQQLEKSFWNSIPQLTDNIKRPDSILHIWENSDSTAVCAQQISTIDTWGDSVKMWRSWSHRKPTEYTYVEPSP